MNNNFPPLYPQEAYSEQNNLNAFSNNKNNAYYENAYSQNSLSQQNQQNQQNPLANILGGLSNSNFNSALLPLLMKALSGGGVSALSDDGSKASSNSDNPLLGILSSFTNNKKTPPKNVGEKQFPD